MNESETVVGDKAHSLRDPPWRLGKATCPSKRRIATSHRRQFPEENTKIFRDKPRVYAGEQQRRIGEWLQKGEKN